MQLTITEYSNDIVEVKEKEITVYIADFDTGIGAIPLDTITAKGSLVAGSGAGTVVELPVGTDGQIILADSSAASGLKWGDLTAADLSSGWTAAPDAPAYASAATLTVPSGAAAIYSVGDKIRFIQERSEAYTNDPDAGTSVVLNMADTSGFNVGNKVLVSSSAGTEVAIITALVTNTSITVDVLALNHTTTSPVVYIGTGVLGIKYGYIVGVADTVLTITGGSDYTLENATVSSFYYSHAESPVGFPQWFNYLPTITGWSSVPVTTARFKVNGKLATVVIRQNTATASNANTVAFTTPVTAATITNMAWGSVLYGAQDNGSAITTACRATISSAGTSISCFKDMSGAAWTTSGNKAVSFSIEYEI